MAVKESEIKKLWGLSAGRCNWPGCEQPCTKLLDAGPVNIGEMAHIIARRPAGPRGIEQGGPDSYENLILLCPNHHTEVDRASPGAYSPSTLLSWKEKHERRVDEALRAPKFSGRKELADWVKRLLIENRTIWSTFGPESPAAVDNPLSNLHLTWTFRKLDTIVPNNRKIVNVLKSHSYLFDETAYAAACLFMEHAETFERSCYERVENAPRFPIDFERTINDYAVS